MGVNTVSVRPSVARNNRFYVLEDQPDSDLEISDDQDGIMRSEAPTETIASGRVAHGRGGACSKPGRSLLENAKAKPKKKPNYHKTGKCNKTRYLPEGSKNRIIITKDGEEIRRAEKDYKLTTESGNSGEPRKPGQLEQVGDPAAPGGPEAPKQKLSEPKHPKSYPISASFSGRYKSDPSSGLPRVVLHNTFRGIKNQVDDGACSAISALQTILAIVDTDKVNAFTGRDEIVDLLNVYSRGSDDQLRLALKTLSKKLGRIFNFETYDGKSHNAPEYFKCLLTYMDNLGFLLNYKSRMELNRSEYVKGIHDRFCEAGVIPLPSSLPGEDLQSVLNRLPLPDRPIGNRTSAKFATCPTVLILEENELCDAHRPMVNDSIVLRDIQGEDNHYKLTSMLVWQRRLALCNHYYSLRRTNPHQRFHEMNDDYCLELTPDQADEMFSTRDFPNIIVYRKWEPMTYDRDYGRDICNVSAEKAICAQKLSLNAPDLGAKISLSSAPENLENDAKGAEVETEAITEATKSTAVEPERTISKPATSKPMTKSSKSKAKDQKTENVTALKSTSAKSKSTKRTSSNLKKIKNIQNFDAVIGDSPSASSGCTKYLLGRGQQHVPIKNGHTEALKLYVEMLSKQDQNRSAERSQVKKPLLPTPKETARVNVCELLCDLVDEFGSEEAALKEYDRRRKQCSKWPDYHIPAFGICLGKNPAFTPGLEPLAKKMDQDYRILAENDDTKSKAMHDFIEEYSRTCVPFPWETVRAEALERARDASNQLHVQEEPESGSKKHRENVEEEQGNSAASHTIEFKTTIMAVDPKNDQLVTEPENTDQTRQKGKNAKSQSKSDQNPNDPNEIDQTKPKPDPFLEADIDELKAQGLIDDPEPLLGECDDVAFPFTQTEIDDDMVVKKAKKSKADPYRRRLMIERLRKLIASFSEIESKPTTPRYESRVVRAPVVLGEDVCVAPHSNTDVLLSVDDDENFYIFECSSQFMGLNHISAGMIRGSKSKLSLSNFTDQILTLKRGFRVGTGRKVFPEQIPLQDDYTSHHKIEITEALNRQIAEDFKLEKKGFSRDEIVARRLQDLQSYKPEDLLVDVCILSAEGCVVVEQDKEKELLPKERSEKDYNEAVASARPEIAQILLRYPGLFSLENPGEPYTFMNGDPITVQIRKDCPERLSPSYRKTYSPQEQEFLNGWLKTNLESGLIVASDSNYVSPLLLVPKRDKAGVYRIVIDVRKINQHILEPIEYPMPTLEECFLSLPSMRWFSVCDMVSAFNRLPCANSEYSTFMVTSGPFRGKYKFTSLCQGWSVSPALFSERISKVLEGLPDGTDTFQLDHDLSKSAETVSSQKIVQNSKIVPYLDDVVCASMTLDAHVRDLNMMLSRLQSANLKLDIRKCSFAAATADYLGMTLGSGQLRVSASRTKDLEDRCKCPDLTKQAIKPWQRLIGLLSYYRRFIENFAEKETKMKAAWADVLDNGSAENVAARTKECSDLISSMVKDIQGGVLAVPAPETELLLMVDASVNALGGVLQTKEKQPIIFISRKFQASEMSMTIFEKELFSVLVLIRKAEPFIRRAKLTRIYSDNKSSVLNLTSYAPITVSARAIKMLTEIRIRIANSSVEFAHIAGIKNVVADSLSRLEADEAVACVETTFSGPDVPVEVALVDHLADVLAADQSGLSFHVNMATTRSKNKTLTVLKALHEASHAGEKRLALMAREHNVRANNLKDLCTQVIEDCQYCNQEVKVMPDTHYGQTYTPDGEFEELCCDHLHLWRSSRGHSYAFTLVDTFSKFFFAFPVQSTGMDEAINCLRVLFTEHPTIRRLKCDNAFRTATMTSFCAEYNVELKFSPSHNSRSNSVERYHREVRKLMKKFLVHEDDESDWEVPLIKSCHALNLTPSTITGFSPYFLSYGRTPMNDGIDHEAAQGLSRAEIREKVLERILKKKGEYTSPESKIPFLEPGTRVRVRFGHDEDPFDVIVDEDNGCRVMATRCNYQGRMKTFPLHKRKIYKIMKGPNSDQNSNKD